MSRLPGPLVLVDADGVHDCGNGDTGDPLELRVRRPRAYRRMALGGSLQAAESYLQGDWECDDLVAVMRVICRHTERLTALESGLSRWVKPLRRAWHTLRRNSQRGSRRNIAEHYDLGNEFFSLMLDPSMTYSSGLFATADAPLEQASADKYDRICRKLALKPGDRVIEVGCGWGGFALHAARNFGCHVTATTISREQFDFARRRVAESGLSDRIEIINRDYRELSGTYDKLVSIEMIEAVGEKYLNQYFERCSDLLTPAGSMMLQSITIPECRYDRYRRSVDFIQRYIFPGGFLPSVGAIARSVGRSTNFRIVQQKDFAEHYALTLAKWRELFWANMDAVRTLGFDERFARMWHYYLCYCEAGFRERQIGLSQILLTKPLARLEMPA